ncbi:MAG: hypothetical protein OXN15_00370 [Chloroflexota bacterium]|nr:hypothetical protein [Chloroflexota bacterium]
MFNLIAPRDLGPIPALAATAFVALAIFGWTERTVLADPDGMSVPHWPWKLWQVGPLLMGFGGVWWIWLSTRRVPWVRSLALGALALAVLVNGYSDLSGDHWGNVWRTINPLFIGSSTVAATALWRTGSAMGHAAGAVSLAMGAIVFANAYFVDNGVLWQALNPLRMLTALAWAAVAAEGNTASSEGGAPASDG